MSICCTIIAAGKGKRFNSTLPKTLLRLGSVPMLKHVVDVATQLADNVSIVVPSNYQQFPEFQNLKKDNISFSIQKTPLGTADAVKCSLQQSNNKAKKESYLLVLYGDTPMINKDICKKLLEKVRSKKAGVGVLGFKTDSKNRYGKLKINERGNVEKIVEYTHKDYDVTGDICNSGLMVIDLKYAEKWLQQITPNKQNGEYYLTDCVELANKDNIAVVFTITNLDNCIGVDNPFQLSRAEKIWQDNKREYFINNFGVLMTDPYTVYFAYDTKIDGQCYIEPFVHFGLGCHIEQGVVIKSFTCLEGVYCHKGSVVGPFSRIREKSEILENARIGSYVEVKNSIIGKNAKSNHLAYIGDSYIGDASNVGAGVITCNYDGKAKHKTTIGKNTFIGSNVALVAPISIGDNAYIAAGSTVTKSVPANTLAIQSRKTLLKKINIKD